MRVRLMLSYLFILIASACVDRFYYDIEKTVNQGISLTGYISNQPGPYEIKIYSIFDIESKETIKTPVTVKSLTLMDNQGNTEILNEVNPGIYQTKPSGIRGVIGGVYKLKIELFDGKIYESLPDTILSISTGSVDSIYMKVTEKYNDVGVKKYGIDVFFDASYNASISNQFLWKFTGTFQGETQPERYNGRSCFYLDGHCNFLPPCSGYRNVGSDFRPKFEKLFPCTCCLCWYNVYNDYLILSDNQFIDRGQLKGVKVQNIPLNQWTLQYKIRVDVSQMRLTLNSFRFWKAVKDQKEAIGNLFQPVTGKIPSNFVQVDGSPTPIEGLFFATAINSRVTYLKQFELPPDIVYQISLEKPLFPDDCRNLFANSSNLKPKFWED